MHLSSSYSQDLKLSYSNLYCMTLVTDDFLSTTLSIIGERSEPPSGLNGTRCLYIYIYDRHHTLRELFKRNHRVQRSTS